MKYHTDITASVDLGMVTSEKFAESPPTLLLFMFAVISWCQVNLKLSILDRYGDGYVDGPQKHRHDVQMGVTPC